MEGLQCNIFDFFASYHVSDPKTYKIFVEVVGVFNKDIISTSTWRTIENVKVKQFTTSTLYFEWL